MSEIKKKSYSKKPSKKERLGAELAAKQAREAQNERVNSGGVFVRADGVAVSAQALAARQAALHAVLQEDAATGASALNEAGRTDLGKKRANSSTRGHDDPYAGIEKIPAPDAAGKRPAHALWCAQALLGEVLTFSAAADKVVSKFLRERKELGARDRFVVAETVYTVLRHKRVLANLAQTGQGALERRLIVLAAAFEHAGQASVLTREWLAKTIAPEELTWVTEVLNAPIDQLSAALQSNLSDEWFAALVAAYGADEALVLTRALNTTAPLDVRVNTIVSTVEAVNAALVEAGVAAQPCTYAPLGLRLVGKPALQKLPIFAAGAIEVQDEGSQLLTHLLGAKRGEMVADFCAGAGGKTLAIGAMMRNTGRLYAFDVAAHRLAKLKPRLAKSGLSNVQSIAMESERDPRIKRLAGKFDRVLVDAPCSGLGTLRRNPDLKWRHGIDSVARLSQLQSSILDSAARLVKNGGVLVYATCSVLPAENQAVVAAFLQAHPEFAVQSARMVLASHKIDVPESAEREGYLQLLPHVHHTDGFFAAYLVKTVPQSSNEDSAGTTEASTDQ